VAMSGGVDSSVAAALLVEQGCRVEGLTLRLYGGGSEEGRDSARGIEHARQVAHQLGIPHRVLEVGELFERRVVQPFVREYQRGRTPNPCVICNATVKFTVLLEYCREMGIPRLATGHYARLQRDSHTGRVLLLSAVDPEKDQSYVLYRLTQEQLRHAVFPNGSLTKDDVRLVARKHNLATASVEESQEICFIQGDYRSFLHEVGLPGRPGPIVHLDGTILGEHQGIERYTVGQRRGLGIAHRHPLYVVSLDLERNAVVVGPKSALRAREAVVSDCNFIPWDRLSAPTRASVKIRYNADPMPATIVPLKDEEGQDESFHETRGHLPRVRVEFDQPVSAATPGQSAVFYQEDVVLGGGIISHPVPLPFTQQ